jgi:hypothetical protein
VRPIDSPFSGFSDTIALRERCKRGISKSLSLRVKEKREKKKKMAFSSMKSLGKPVLSFASSSSGPLKSALLLLQTQSPYKYRYLSSSSISNQVAETEDDVAAASSGISRPLSEILKELNKKVPDSLIKVRLEDGFSMKYIPWYHYH